MRTTKKREEAELCNGKSDESIVRKTCVLDRVTSHIFSKLELLLERHRLVLIVMPRQQHLVGTILVMTWSRQS